MEKFAITVKSFIVNNKGELLITKRPENIKHKPGVWEIQGGRLEMGESPFSGLKREVKEEVNLEIKIQNPLKIHHFVRGDEQKITMIVFLCQPITDKVILSDEHTDFKWLDIDEAKNLLTEDFHEEVDIYNQCFKK